MSRPSSRVVAVSTLGGTPSVAEEDRGGPETVRAPVTAGATGAGPDEGLRGRSLVWVVLVQAPGARVQTVTRTERKAA